MITPSLRISRERDDHRPDGDNTACLWSASYWDFRASSASSPQGGGTRLFSFFMKSSGMDGPRIAPRAAKRCTEQYRARQPGPAGRRAGGGPAVDSSHHGRSAVRAPADASRGSRQRYTPSSDPQRGQRLPNTGEKDNRLDFLRGSTNDRCRTNEYNLVNAICSSDLPHRQCRWPDMEKV